MHPQPADRRVEDGDTSPYVRQLRHFGEVVARRTEPLVSAREGARNLAVMDAVARAVATGTTATVRAV